MFNVGPGELFVIVALALIVLGPNRLPEAVRTAGRVVGEVRRITGSFQQELRSTLEDDGRDPRGSVEEQQADEAEVAEAEDVDLDAWSWADAADRVDEVDEADEADEADAEEAGVGLRNADVA